MNAEKGSGYKQWCERKKPDDNMFYLAMAHMVKRIDLVFKSETDIEVTLNDV